MSVQQSGGRIEAMKESGVERVAPAPAMQEAASAAPSGMKITRLETILFQVALG